MSNYKNIAIKFAIAEQPVFEEKKGKGWMEFGKNNNYPDYLLSLYSDSPKHGAIIKGKANYIFGKGVKDAPVANTVGETFNQIIKKAIIDDEIFCGYYLQIVFNLLGKIKDVYHIDFKKVRVSKDGSKFYVKNKWEDNREDARCYNKFTGIYDAENPTQILSIKQYNPKGDVYPVPNYLQGLNYIESDVQVSRHILGNAKDGFVASTLINLNGGDPVEEEKGAVERDLKKKFTGSEGDRVVIMFNRSKDNAAEILPLSPTMLTKEDFTNVNNLIQQEIFACHQITSPMLFGIKTEGQLGGRSELQDAYEIFNNTYVNERQQAHEEVFGKLFKLMDIKIPATITPVEPLGFNLKDDLLVDVLPREYFMDKLGVDQKYYSLPPARTQSAPGVSPTVDVSGNVNSNLTNMTGKQFQHLDRIKRKFVSGKLTRGEAAMMLKNSFGLSDEDISILLDGDSMDSKFASQDEIDNELYEQFASGGEDLEGYEIIDSKPATYSEYFGDVAELSKLDAKILELIKKDNLITAATIAGVLGKSEKVVQAVIDNLVKGGLLVVNQVQSGSDTVTELKPTGVKVDAPKITQMYLRYQYTGPEDDRNRPFCAKMMALKRIYSRQDIEDFSVRLGYSVWDRRGGWFTQPDGSHRPYCRHSWSAITVIKKG